MAAMSAACRGPGQTRNGTDEEQNPRVEIAATIEDQRTKVEVVEEAVEWVELESGDEVTRARAARRLWERGHPRALEANLRVLDDAPDGLHPDYTPAVGALVAIGEPALDPLIERLDAPEEMTRRRAANAISGITKGLFGYDGQRWSGGEEAQWRDWWWAIGYDARLDAAGRKPKIDALRAWSAARKSGR